MRPGPRHASGQLGGPRHVRAPRQDHGGTRPAPGGRWRRTTLTAVGLVLALIAALTLSANAISPPTPEPAPAPALLGAGASAVSGTAASQEATRRLETAIGRQLNIGHSFVPWGADLGELPAANLAAGRTPMISFGRDSKPREVASGRHDRYLAALARDVAALGQPVLLRYAWGMDAAGRRTTRSGSAFVAAWRHVHQLFAARGVRAFWVWSPNADAFAGARGGADQYWPGDDYVDWVGADGFNWGDCTVQSTWRDFGSIFKAFYAWGSARAKPLMISGTGTIEDPIDPGRKRGWYLDAAATLARSMPRVRAVVVLDQGGRCDWRPDTSALSMQGFVDFARDPFFSGAAASPAAAPTTTGRPPITTPATSTTVAPTTKAPTTTAPASAPASTCSASGGVAIGTGDDAQRVVDAHSAGTTYLVKAGTHARNFSVRPKSGDTFCGEPGAILDGGRSLRSAFSGGATNVTLDSITVQQYATGRQGGAIWPDTHASGWTVRNVSAVHNYWAGLKAGDNMKILGGHYNDNDQLGISGNAATGVVLDGLDGDPATFDGPELARNHTMHESCTFEAGGMKWDVGRVTIRNAHVHHNDCRGLWADINAHDALVEHNLIEDNWAEGIFYEISQDAVIRDNRVYRNGTRGAGWYWDGGITVPSSFNVEIYGNRLSGNYNGITGTQQDRPDSAPPAHLLDNLRVHDNLICATRGEHPTGVVADNGDNLAARSIAFSGNTIQSATCT
jgi:hypothetical protein